MRRCRSEGSTIAGLRAGLATLGGLAIGALACGGPAPEDPATRCAEVVRSSRGLETVEVAGTPTQSSEATVAIEWRGADPDGLPVEGSAECTFAVGAGDELTLVAASVDGAPIDAAAIR